MKQHHGFTLIEIIIFIIITALLAKTILLVLNTAALNTPKILQNTIANETAQQCMEWFIGQRQLNGYSSITCPSTSVPSFCSAPTGYTVAVNIQCTTINSDANYQTITVTISGKGDAGLTTLIANY